MILSMQVRDMKYVHNIVLYNQFHCQFPELFFLIIPNRESVPIKQ